MKRAVIILFLLLPPLVATVLIRSMSDPTVVNSPETFKPAKAVADQAIEQFIVEEKEIEAAIKKSTPATIIEKKIIVKDKKEIKKRVVKATKKLIPIIKKISKNRSITKKITKKSIVARQVVPTIRNELSKKLPVKKISLEEIPDRVVIKGHTSSLIDNSELVEHYGYNVGASKVESYASDLSKLKIKGGMDIATYLANLEQDELRAKIKVAIVKKEVMKKVVAVSAQPKTELAKVKNKKKDIIEDNVKSRLAATDVTTQSLGAVPIFYDYSKKIDDIKKDSFTKKIEMTSSPGGKTLDKSKRVKKNQVERRLTGVASVGSRSKIIAPTKKIIKRNNIKIDSYNPLIAANRKRVSTRVERAIKREMNGQPAMNTQSAESSSLLRVAENSQSTAKTKSMSTQKYSRSPAIESGVAQLTVRAVSIDLSGQLAPLPLSGHQFEPLYDRNIRLSDNRHSGGITISHKLKADTGEIKGRVITEHGITTNISVVTEGGKFEVTVPILLIDELERALEGESSGGVGHLLLDLEDHSIEISLDVESGKRFYLNRDFKPTTVDGDYRYLLITDIAAGNVLLSHHQSNELTIPRIINIVQDELLFESVQFRDGGQSKIELRERRLMSDVPFDLSLSSEDVSLFAMETKFQKSGLNQFDFYLDRHAYGSRNYFEFGKGDQAIFVGAGEANILEIPSKKFQDHILSLFDLDNLSNRCMLQINPRGDISQFTAGGTSGRGNMHLTTIFLDVDGVISDEAGSLTKKIFLSADEQGVINFQLKYADGSVDLVKSICSLDSYVVEQL
jgi:hypothetical protein